MRNRVHHLSGHAVAFDGIDLRAGNLRTRLLRAEQLQALAGAVGTLIILTGQIFHGKQVRIHLRERFIIKHIGVRFRKDDAACTVKRLVGKPFDVVTLKNTHTRDGVRSECLTQFVTELAGGNVISGALFRINSSDLAHNDLPPCDYSLRKN